MNIDLLFTTIVDIFNSVMDTIINIHNSIMDINNYRWKLQLSKIQL